MTVPTALKLFSLQMVPRRHMTLAVSGTLKPKASNQQQMVLNK